MNKNLVVLDPSLKKKEMDLPLIEANIDGHVYLFSMVDAILEEKKQIDDYSVVVEIYAFSCNYRDKGILKNFF